MLTVGNKSSVHTDNRKNTFLELGGEPSDQGNDKLFRINFAKANT